MMSEGSLVYSLVQLAVNFFVYLFFILGAFKGKLNYQKWVHRSLIAGYIAVSLVVIPLFFLKNSPLFHYKYPMLFVWLCGTVMMAMLVLRSHLLQLLFFIFILLDVQFNTMQISNIIYTLDIFPDWFTGTDLKLFTINTVVLLVFIPPMWYLFMHLFKKVINMNIDKIYWRYLFVIPISAYFFCIFSTSNHFAVSQDRWAAELLIMLLLNIFSFLSYVAVLQMLIKTHENLIAIEMMVAAQRQLMIQDEQYRKMTENIKQTQRLRHDLRHHFITLKGYVESRNLVGANQYLDLCIDKELPKEEVPFCENRSVDTILRYYIAQARENGVQVKVFAELPNHFKVPDTELCVIFGNLFENALEGCMRQVAGRKFISIKVKLLNEDMLAITISNSYAGDVVLCGGEFPSQKHPGVGIGTGSVKSIVERNGGNCKFSFENNVFKASVLLVP